jgi:uncharacterized membrane protein
MAIRKILIHPALVGFPITFLTSALATDFLFWATGASQWADFSFWLILAGWLAGLAGILTGLIDFLTIERARSLTAGWLHFLSADLAIFITTFNLIARWPDHQAPVLFTGIVFSGIAAALLVVAGNLGGRLVFRHRIGLDAPEVQAEEERSE